MRRKAPQGIDVGLNSPQIDPLRINIEEFAEFAKGMTGAQQSALGRSAAYFPYFAVSTEFDNTRALDGMQRDGWRKFKASWTYHPDDGLSIVIHQ